MQGWARGVRLKLRRSELFAGNRKRTHAITRRDPRFGDNMGTFDRNDP